MLPPELAKQIRLLEIRTNRAVDEITGGAYRSVFKGRGIDFEFGGVGNGVAIGVG